VTDNHRAHLLMDGRCWELGGRVDSERFFESIGSLLPDATTLFLEAGSMASDVEMALNPHLQEPTLAPNPGTIWPKSRMYQLPFHSAVLKLLTDMASRHAEPELCDHLHVYGGTTHLLEWYDAFSDPVYLAPTVGAERVRDFAQAVGTQYRQRSAAV